VGKYGKSSDGKTNDPDISEDVKITLFYRFGMGMTMNC